MKRFIYIFTIGIIIFLGSCSQESKVHNEALRIERENIEREIDSLNVMKDTLNIQLSNIKENINKNTVILGNLESEERNQKLQEIRTNTENEINRLNNIYKELFNKNNNLHKTIDKNITLVKELNYIYIIKIKIHQTTYSLDIGEHIKNHMNDITLEIPVDKTFYDRCSVGSRIDESFKWGSLLCDGDFSELKIKVINKRIIKR